MLGRGRGSGSSLGSLGSLGIYSAILVIEGSVKFPIVTQAMNNQINIASALYYVYIFRLFSYISTVQCRELS